jgi:hypothetical protein
MMAGLPVEMRITPRLLVFLCIVVAVISITHFAGEAHYDFGIYRYAARMVWDGAGGSLYDVNAQRAYQLRYGRPSYFFINYSPLSLVPFLPLALLPPPVDFVVWTMVSIALVVVTVVSLCRRLEFRFANWPVLAAIGFTPVACTLAHGQLSILVMAALVWCYCLSKDGRPMTAGAVLAIATVKPQAIAGFICVLLLKRRWRELAGFALACIPLAVLSWLLVGVRGLVHYPAFLAQCKDLMPPLEPFSMANLRGLVVMLSGGEHPWIVIALSLAVLTAAAAFWKDLDSGFAAATLASILVSYYLYTQDLTIALLPLFLGIKRCAPARTGYLALFALFAPLTLLSVGHRYFALLALPVLAMLVWVGRWEGPSQPKRLNRREPENSRGQAVSSAGRI